MGATLKSLIPQATQASGETAALAASLIDFPSVATWKDLRQLSQFLPVIVLVPKAAVEGRDGCCAIVTSQALTAATGKRLEQLNTILLQPENPGTGSETVFGDVKINFLELTALREDQPITLTAMEFKTLKYLMHNAKRVISREELLNEVWGYENYPNTRTVDNHILKLRRKLEREPAEPRHFITVHRIGYKFMP